MIVLRMLLVAALISQLSVTYRCCAMADLCRLKKCGVAAEMGACMSPCCEAKPVVSCCGDSSAPCNHEHEDDQSESRGCLCENPLVGREPVDAIPSSDDLVIAISLVLLMEPVAVDLRAIEPNVPPDRFFARLALPTGRRLATFCVWRN